MGFAQSIQRSSRLDINTRPSATNYAPIEPMGSICRKFSQCRCRWNDVYASPCAGRLHAPVYGKVRAQASNAHTLPKKKLSPVVWVGAFILATVWAVGMRDFWTLGFLNSLTEYLRPIFSFWPPELFGSIQLYYPISEDAPKTSAILTLSMLFAAYVTASAAQTLYFRGFLLSRMDRWGWLAVVTNGLLFAAFHIHSPEFWGQFFVWTLMWGIVTYVTKNVWPAVISHMVFNGYGWIVMIVEIVKQPT